VSAFKLSEWNDVIDAINDIRANPPSDTNCDPLPPIEHWENSKPFCKSEVRRVRAAIAETCGSISFPDMDTPQLIKRQLLTQLNDAMGQAWCDCEPDANPCASEDGTVIILRTDAYNIYSSFDPSDEGIPCGYPPQPEDFPGSSFNAIDLIEGQVLALPNRIFRSWEMFWTLPTGNEVFICNGPILCSGVPDTSDVDPDSTGLFETAWADASCTIGDTCETCGAKFDSLTASPRYVGFRIFAALAACEDCP
jgi:hypothetical protein